MRGGKHGAPTLKVGAVTYRKTFALGGNHEPVVEADELERRGPPFRRQEGGSKLEGVGSTDRMDPQEAPGGLENRVHGVDPVPVSGEGVQALEGLGRRLGRELAFTLETR